ncbi:hypothetical protein ACF0H5_018440 [Mactra antiquata]
MATGSNHVTRRMFVLVIFYAIIEVTNAATGPLKTCDASSRPAPGGFCGASLDRTIELICGKGNFGERGKRSIMDNSILDMNLADFVALSQQNAQRQEQESRGALEDFFLQKAAATKFLSKRIAFTQSGASCECCYHVCNLRELRSYCKDPSKAIF